MSGYTSLAKCTLGISWALTSLGFASTTLPVLVLGEFKTDDGLVATSFLLSAALVSLSTWAIVDEGQGSHETDMSATQLEHMAKVRMTMQPRPPRGMTLTHLRGKRSRFSSPRRSGALPTASSASRPACCSAGFSGSSAPPDTGWLCSWSCVPCWPGPRCSRCS